MRIGFANLFAYRPHVQHLKFLAEICQKDGHIIHYLTCDGELNACYTKLIRQKTGKFSRKIECAKCVMGGIRSYTNKSVDSISAINTQMINSKNIDLQNLSLSSAATILRVESDKELEGPDVVEIQNNLVSSIEKIYCATLNWIRAKNLDSIVVFNGRMDITAAVIRAAEDSKINYVTHERTWFGDGIRIIPNNNCLSIADIRRIANIYKNLPLTKDQSIFAAKLMAMRFKGINTLEWRLYNKNGKDLNEWPSGNLSGKNYLVIPSSRNEFMGNKEFKTSWKDNTTAIKDLVEIFGIKASEVVVRGHPNWSENIAKSTGKRSSEHYSSFCKKMGFTYIPSDSNVCTYSLIKQADVVITNGGSSTIEAATLGKPVICLTPSQFQDSGFITTYTSRKSMLEATDLFKKLPPETVTKLAMRHIYIAARRFPMFVDEVKAVSTTHYEYADRIVSSKPLIDILNGQKLVPYDCEYGKEDDYENTLVSLLHSMSWDEIMSIESCFDKVKNAESKRDIQRRGCFKHIDYLRNYFKRGDL
jgi:hypothetical protein